MKRLHSLKVIHNVPDAEKKFSQKTFQKKSNLQKGGSGLKE